MKLRAPNYAEVASTLALTLALGTGGAYAAGQITSQDIAKNAVTSKQIKNGAVKEKDLNKRVVAKLNAAGPAGPAGAAGPAGTTGPAGATGPRGFSAWDQIPSGVSVQGQEYVWLGSGAPVNVTLPGAARVPLTDEVVNFAADADAVTQDDDAACTGTYAHPTAPAGKVCLYPGYTGSATSAYANAWSNAALRTHAFYVYFDGTGDLGNVYFTWAYTAP